MISRPVTSVCFGAESTAVLSGEGSLLWEVCSLATELLTRTALSGLWSSITLAVRQHELTGLASPVV
ncbi:MAG: hypothetical protein MUQ10_09190 [Anaerolineae bacterium]|nr:hypothetical protein [Anaerolineae bacterium]